MTRSALSAAALQPGGTIPTICACCGVEFHAKHVSAAYCSDACRCRAYRYRRQGRPVPGTPARIVARTQPIRPQVVQAQLMEDPDDLPLSWRTSAPEPTPAAALEVREWNGTAIQRRDADGYVNATAMCKANGKHLPHYLANDRTRQYLQALAGSVGIPTDLMVQSVVTGPNDQRGTWVHPRVAVDMARWLAPVFAVWMDGWFLESMAAPAAAAQPPQLQLPEGVHVVAATRRRAAELWYQAIKTELLRGLSGRLNPTHRTDAGLPRYVAYSWQPNLI